MVIRSLIVKTYIYAIIVFVVMMIVTVMAQQMIDKRNENHPLRRFGIDLVSFVGHESEMTFTASGPDKRRLAELSRSHHLVTEYVPWNVPSIPAELRDKKLLAFGPNVAWPETYWYRLDVDEQPRGALKMHFQSGPADPWEPIRGIAFVMVLLGLMILPPLIIWVLNPLKRMVAVANRLGNGEFDRPVPIDRKDEFGDLEQAFESMRTRILVMFEQKQRLLMDISHELRSPLTRLSLAVPLAREGEDADVFFDDITREVRNMNQLIEELLDYARGQSSMGVQQTHVDLASLADEVLQERRLPIQAKGMRLSTTLEATPMLGDPYLLQRALGNLLDNAIKYGHEGGRIDVRTSVEGDHVVFSVDDNGPGVAAADLPQLFEPFYRPDTSRNRATGGTGLGLSIVKAIAEGHRGTVELKSQEGKGTSVRLQFPIHHIPVA